MKVSINEGVNKLARVSFIIELKYPTWLANMVMVKKASNKWHMCLYFTDLNKACPKDPYLLQNIGHPIDGSLGYQTQSFMDAYSWYNQIKMDPLDAPKTTFMLNHGNYYYNVMPTDQRLVDSIFCQQIGKILEVYIDDMVVNTS